MSVSSYQGKGRTRHSTVAKMRHLAALAALTIAPSAAVVVGTSPDGTALLAPPNPNGKAAANTRRADAILGKATAWQMLALRRHPPSDMLRSRISQNLSDAAGFQAQQRSGGRPTQHFPPTTTWKTDQFEIRQAHVVGQLCAQQLCTSCRRKRIDQRRISPVEWWPNLLARNSATTSWTRSRP